MLRTIESLISKVRLNPQQHKKHTTPKSLSDQIINSQYETFYVSATEMAAKSCEMSVALIAHQHNDCIWMYSNIESAHMVQIPKSKDEFYDWATSYNHFIEIRDILRDSDHFKHPLITNSPTYRFYASVPLKLPLGEVGGVISVFDIKPNKLDRTKITTLIGLADVIGKALAIRNKIAA